MRKSTARLRFKTSDRNGGRRISVGDLTGEFVRTIQGPINVGPFFVSTPDLRSGDSSTPWAERLVSVRPLSEWRICE
jgi:hypothetical protein